MKRNFNDFIKQNKWIKSVPNTLTICNSLSGFLAILNMLQVYNPELGSSAVAFSNSSYVLAISACMILGAMVFDALDGFTARILNATSLKGLQMDSLADMVTFGVAPAILVAVLAHINASAKYSYIITWILCGIYLASAASRLATYNVNALLEKKSGKGFNGLPSPGAAAAICSLVLLYCKFDSLHGILKFLPVYSGLLGLLMISDIQYLHIGKWLESVRRNKFRLSIISIIIICFIFAPIITLAVVINAYILYGFFKHLVVKLFYA